MMKSAKMAHFSIITIISPLLVKETSMRWRGGHGPIFARRVIAAHIAGAAEFSLVREGVA